MFKLQEKNIRLIFIASLIIKAFNSVFEIIGGLLFLFTGTITTFISAMIDKELAEDPTDFLSTHIQHTLPFFSGHSQLYISFYLLSHGIIKIILVVCLFNKKIWAYPATIAVLFLFVFYQVYRLFFGFSLFYIVLTLFDLFIIALTWHEYKVVRKHLK